MTWPVNSLRLSLSDRKWLNLCSSSYDDISIWSREHWDLRKRYVSFISFEDQSMAMDLHYSRGFVSWHLHLQSPFKKPNFPQFSVIYNIIALWKFTSFTLTMG
jgi:hypothetical protein